ncbi:MAG: beta strand repeat-containing protein, partial [Rhodoluna sp.]
TFNREGSTASVVNEGRLQAAAGGYIALLAPEVRNQGVVVAQAGTVALATGEAITLNFNQSGTGLAGITTTAQAIAALVENRSAVLAEGGQIILSAHALATLQGAIVKNSGRLSATSLVDKGGKIVLMGDSIELTATSQIDANGPAGGGTVLVGGDWQGSGDTRQATQVSMAQGASIEANATQQGDGGKVVLWSDTRKADSVTRVEGRIEAKGAGTGQGGQVETSGHKLQVGDGASVSTRSSQGQSGQWLIDPNDFTVAATGGDMTGATLSANLGASGGNVTITSASGTTTSSTNGSIFINDAVAWSDHTLTLNAQNNVTVNKTMDLTGTAGLAVQYGQNALAAAATGLFTVNAPVNIANTGSFSTKFGTDGSVVNYTIVNSLGVAADATTAPATPSLQGMAKNLTASFVLGSDIDASSTASWNTATGFKPIGNSSTAFSGKFNGLGHTISGLTINAGTSDYQGLFGKITGDVSNVILSVPSVLGRSYVGSLSGYGANAYNIRLLGGSVTGTSYLGGLSGYVNGTVDTVTASTNVNGQDSASAAAQYVGGVAGVGNGAINNTTVSGNVVVTNANTAFVTGASAALSIHSVGGLVGQLAPTASMTLSNNIGTGNVTVTTATASSASNYMLLGVGGLIGTLGSNAINTNGNWRVTVSNSSTSGNVSASSTTTASMSSNTTAVALGTGGVIGRVDYSAATGFAFGGGLTLTNLSSSGAITGYSGLGGVLGYSNLGSSGTVGSNVFSNLVATGNVTGFGSTQSNYYPSSYISNFPSYGMGGVIGSSFGAKTALISSSHYDAGAIIGNGGTAIGGLVGTSSGFVADSYSSGSIVVNNSPFTLSLPPG